MKVWGILVLFCSLYAYAELPEYAQKMRSLMEAGREWEALGVLIQHNLEKVADADAATKENIALRTADLWLIHKRNLEGLVTLSERIDIEGSARFPLEHYQYDQTILFKSHPRVEILEALSDEAVLAIFRMSRLTTLQNQRSRYKSSSRLTRLLDRAELEVAQQVLKTSGTLHVPKIFFKGSPALLLNGGGTLTLLAAGLAMHLAYKYPTTFGTWKVLWIPASVAALWGLSTVTDSGLEMVNNVARNFLVAKANKVVSRSSVCRTVASETKD